MDWTEITIALLNSVLNVNFLFGFVVGFLLGGLFLYRIVYYIMYRNARNNIKDLKEEVANLKKELKEQRNFYEHELTKITINNSAKQYKP